MPTQCIQKSFAFHALGKRDVVARFDGGRITSDAGGLLLRRSSGSWASCGDWRPASTITAIPS